MRFRTNRQPCHYYISPKFFFGLIEDDTIKEWSLLLTFRDIPSIIMSNLINSRAIELLKSLISQHHITSFTLLYTEGKTSSNDALHLHNTFSIQI